jgi:hypothetical protein
MRTTQSESGRAERLRGAVLLQRSGEVGEVGENIGAVGRTVYGSRMRPSDASHTRDSSLCASACAVRGSMTVPPMSSVMSCSAMKQVMSKGAPSTSTPVSKCLSATARTGRVCQLSGACFVS